MQTKNHTDRTGVVRAFLKTLGLNFSELLHRLLLGLSLISTIVGVPTSVVFAASSTFQSPPPCAYPVPDMLYAVRTIEMAKSEIWIIDPDTQTVLCSSLTNIQDIAQTISDIAFDQNNPVAFDQNSLYGVTGPSNYLLRIHPANWGISDIISIGAGSISSLAIGDDGFAYGTADDSTAGSRFVQIDRITGTVILKDYLLLEPYAPNFPIVLSTGDLAFREDGVLFAAVQTTISENWWLATVDRNTGAATLVGDIGHAKVTGLSFRHGILYGITEDGKMLRIDPTSGIGTVMPILPEQLPAGFQGLSTHVKPGDANGDGQVDGIDYVIWLNHYNWQTSRGRAEGDFNGDGVVDGIDYVTWLNNYGK